MEAFLDVQTGRRGDATRQERWSAATSAAIFGLHRYCKMVLLYEADNEAAAVTVDQCHEAIRELIDMVGGRVAFTFVQDTIFVAGEPLKASRKVYAVAMELADLLKRCGASEIGFAEGVERSDLIRLAAPLRRALQTRGGEELAAAELPNVSFREVHALLEARGAQTVSHTTRDRVIEFYASALVALRQYLEAVARGAHPAPTQVKRLAQQLVTLSASGDASLVGMSTMAHAHRDDAGRSLQAAILAVALGRKITDDKLSLARIAMAALLGEAGRSALIGTEGRGKLVQLTPHQQPYVPMATAAVTLAAGGVNRAAATRAVTTYETTWLEQESMLGPVYTGQMEPLVQSKLLRMVRALFDRLAPRSTKAAMSPVEALQDLMRQPWMEPIYKQMLISVLGFVPAGTLVELNDASWAVVVGASPTNGSHSYPLVRVMSGPGGRSIPAPFELDLADENSNFKGLKIARVVEER
jgi:HD-GYP domain-containing protein (c-di-GMP phosphodiesterase class II)